MSFLRTVLRTYYDVYDSLLLLLRFPKLLLTHAVYVQLLLTFQ